MRLIITFCLLILSFAFTGCYYDKEEIVYPTSGATGPCDTTIVRYAAIQSLINSKCTNCHTGATTSGIALTTYGAVNAQANEMLRRVTLPTTHSSFMPRGGSRLPDCEIGKIRTWIRNGKPQ